MRRYDPRTVSTSDYVRIKSKFEQETHRFSVLKSALSFDVLISEVCRVHGIATKDRDAILLRTVRDAKVFDAERIASVADENRLLSLRVEMTKPTEKIQVIDELNLTRPPFNEEPYPWPKRVITGPLPPVTKFAELKAAEDVDETLEPPADIRRRFKQSITLFVNGRRLDVHDVLPNTLLAQFLRTQVGATGTKISCGEGGCGACTVMLSSVDPVSGEIVHRTTNACMRLLATCDGMAITNATGVGNSQDGFSPIQSMISKHGASQCGQCTPGFVTAMFALLATTDGAPSQEQVEDQLQGNLCRCTGFRSILDAFREFSTSAPEQPLDGEVGGVLDRIEDLDLEALRPEPLFLRKDGFLFFRPTTIEDVIVLTRHYARVPLKLVVGNTAIGVVKHFPDNAIPEDDPRVVIDVGKIPELLQISTENNSLVVGASVTITNLINTLLELKDQSTTFQRMAEHFLVVASPAIRNTGAWIGNVFTAKTHPEFPSDLLTVLSSVGAEITLTANGREQTLSMQEFLRFDFQPGNLVLRLNIPFADDTVRFDSIKVRGRVNLAHPILNAGFWTRMNGDTIEEARIVFGGLQARGGPRFARLTARFLEGRTFSKETLQRALVILAGEVLPISISPNAIHTQVYRRNLAINSFYKFFLKQQAPGDVDPQVRDAVLSLFDERPPSSGTMVPNTPNENFAPVSEPIEHITALRQATGEVMFTEDEAVSQNSVFVAPVLSTVAKAKILSIDARPALRLEGVIDFISAIDLEEAGISNDIGSRPGDELLFTTTEVNYVGQIIGAIVTESKDSELAVRAARLVVVHYKREHDFVLTMDQALANMRQGKAAASHVEQPAHVVYKRGDTKKALQDCDHVVTGSMKQGLQHHFYMEPQSAIAIPQDGDAIKVIAATQGPSPTAEFIASILGIPQNKVVVETRRDGGAYGGKYSRSRPNIALATVVARILRRPARSTNERINDFTNIGGRNEYQDTYTVGFDDDGHIHAVEMDIVTNGGDGSASAGGAQSFADNAYNIEHFTTTGTGVSTNRPVQTIMRAPGSVNGVFFMEQVIERVAAETGVDASIVREMHFYKDGDRTPAGIEITDSTLDEVWSELMTNFEFERKVHEVEHFNARNRFKKRGVAATPVKYRLGLGQTQGAFINIQGSDASIQVTTSGAESGQGLVTKVAQAVAFRLGAPFETITVMTNSTEKIPNFSTTGGSASSEECVEAALLTADILVERLQPFRDQLGPNASFHDVVMRANSSVNLSASELFRGGGISYFIWGAALTVAEIDVLTGEQLILESDIVYDCGQSLNPLVDLGQVEGAFIQGLGFATLEQVALNKDGSEATASTWDYHVPCAKSIPLSFNLSFLDKTPNPVGILGSKAQGEPPLLLSASVFFAVKNAINAAREQSGDAEPFDLNTPLTFEQTQLACKVQLSALTF